MNLKEQTATSINGITFKLTETKQGEYEGISATNKVLRYRGMAFFRMEDNRIAEVWTHSNWGTKFAKLTK